MRALSCCSVRPIRALEQLERKVTVVDDDEQEGRDEVRKALGSGDLIVVARRVSSNVWKVTLTGGSVGEGCVVGFALSPPCAAVTAAFHAALTSYAEGS